MSYATPSVTDAVGATVSCVPASGSTFPIGTSTVLCTASDAAGNTATRSFTVTVNSLAARNNCRRHSDDAAVVAEQDNDTGDGQRGGDRQRAHQRHV